ncbi:MAG: glycosyltransferase [Lachnospiraceae bacterium]|nr:glycosyltransferase [Lachnospiraceae bacterium]
MELNEKISIIVPVYKVEAYLDRCIKSIVSQSYQNLEIILVDDGSPDQCPHMCDIWAQKDERIKVIHKQNGGLSDARNAGIHVATGTVIGFVDSDDWLEKDFCKTLLTVMNANNCDIVSCKFKKRYFQDEIFEIKETGSITILDRGQSMKALIEDNQVQQVVWNKLYRKELIERITFAIGKCHEDEFWSYQVIGASERLGIVDYTGYNYYQRNDSIMGSDFSIKRLDVIEAKVQRQKYLERNFPLLSEQGLANLYFLCMYTGQLALRFASKEDREVIFKKIDGYLKQCRISHSMFKKMKISHQIWLYLARVSLINTCRLRNILKIGM